MTKQRRILIAIVIVGCIVLLGSIVCIKRLALTDYSQDTYIYEEKEFSSEADVISEEYVPTEK